MICNACGTRLRIVANDGDATLSVHKIGNARLDLRLRQGPHAAGVVCDCVENAAVGDDGDTDAIDLGIEQIGAMTGRVHPLVVNLGRRWTDSDVFFNQIEVCACLPRAPGNIGLTPVTVRDRSFSSHAHAMLPRSCRKRFIPLQPACAILSPSLIRECKELLCRGRYQLIGARHGMGRSLRTRDCREIEDRKGNNQDLLRHSYTSFKHPGRGMPRYAWYANAL